VTKEKEKDVNEREKMKDGQNETSRKRGADIELRMHR